MRLKVWGARGSVPAPGPEMNRYGGNTSCVQVTLPNDEILILDAGTGIRTLGLGLEPTARIHILLTHLHLDHIQGLMFFPPCFRAESEIIIWGPSSPEASLEDRIARYISAPLSPVEVRELPCSVSFRDTPASEWELGGAKIRAEAVTHRGPTLGYRISDGTSTVAYIPDHEPSLGRAARRPRAGVDLGLRPRPRGRPADPRLPVHRRGVPRPHRLGAFGRSPTRSPSPSGSRRSGCCSSTTTRCMPTGSSTTSTRAPGSAGPRAAATPRRSRWAIEGAEVEIGAEHGDCPECPRLSAGAFDRRYNESHRNLRQRDNHLPGCLNLPWVAIPGTATAGLCRSQRAGERRQ